MAVSKNRIRTPLREHLRQMRYQLIPVLVFLSGIYATGLLWESHMELPNGIGAVKALRVDIVSPVDGVLIEIPGVKKQLDMFDTVKKGQLVCKFDGKAVRATIASIKAEVKQLNAQLLATDAQMTLDFAETRADRSDRRQDILDDGRRLAVDLERLKLDVADRTIELESGRIALQRHVEKLKIVKDLVKKKLETTYVLSDTQLQHDVQKKEIAEQEKALVKAKAMEAEAQVRVDKFNKMLSEEDALNKARNGKGSLAASIQEEIDVFLKPIRAAIEVQEALLNGAQAQLRSLEVHVPPSVISSGTIVEIYRMPGQAVRAGEPIMRIANLDSMYIVSYVRQPYRVELKPTTPVEVQVRSIPIKGALTTIDKVGPQIESVPSRQLRDPKIPEWGLPVKIRVPEELELTPGELVNITFRAASS